MTRPSSDHVEVRQGVYYDSVSLMQVSRAVRDTPGVSDAMIGMGTELNLELIRGAGFTLPDGVGPNDLAVALRGADEESVQAGLAALERVLTDLVAAARASGGLGSDVAPPRTLGSAHGATLALISVPGRYAFADAMDALAAGQSVMLFSDNVSLEHEVALKRAATDAGLLVMGPDCGTAVVSGVALGFANAGRPAEPGAAVGIVAASGTGAQQVICLLDAAGVGVTHCLGVGGRDLSAAVGGLSTRAALAALQADPATEAILVVSKPGDPTVVAAVTDTTTTAGEGEGTDTSVHWATLGAGRPDLTASVEATLAALGREVPAWPTWGAATSDDEHSTDDRASADRCLRGLFCGGTLADEAMLVAQEALGDIRSNIPLRPELALASVGTSEGHTVVDFGDDELTQGRAHPMIDPSLRLERIAAEAADPTCGVLLLDLVLGYGAHPDPAGELAQAISEARATAAAQGRSLPVVVSLIGTAADPQGLERCAAALADAGAQVFLSNAAAAREAVRLLAPHTPVPATTTSEGSR